MQIKMKIIFNKLDTSSFLYQRKLDNRLISKVHSYRTFSKNCSNNIKTKTFVIKSDNKVKGFQVQNFTILDKM